MHSRSAPGGSKRPLLYKPYILHDSRELAPTPAHAARVSEAPASILGQDVIGRHFLAEVVLLNERGLVPQRNAFADSVKPHLGFWLAEYKLTVPVVSPIIE